MEQEERLKLGNKISRVTIVWNVILAGLKVVAGLIGNSGAMLADGIHSISDIVSTAAVMIGINIAGKPKDENHPYGHEKLEPIVAKLLAIILVLTALGIGYEGLQTIATGEYEVPATLTIYAAVLSIIVKEGMYRYVSQGAKQIDSSALLADAWHHRSDVFSSAGTLVAIIGARLGYKFFDPLAALIICGLIIKVAVDIYIQSVHQLVDHAGSEETIAEIKQKILEVTAVKAINDLKTRQHGSKLYVDVEIAVNKELSVLEGHEIAEKVHDKIEREISKVKHCMIHVEPYLPSEK